MDTNIGVRCLLSGGGGGTLTVVRVVGVCFEAGTLSTLYLAHRQQQIREMKAPVRGGVEGRG